LSEYITNKNSFTDKIIKYEHLNQENNGLEHDGKLLKQDLLNSLIADVPTKNFRTLNMGRNVATANQFSKACVIL
jgi:hypothetical protein